MAKGFQSCHPLTEQALRELGITSQQVLQGWGSADASAGFHEPVGTRSGRQYSTCVDLATSIGTSEQTRARLVQAGFAPFLRGEADDMSPHWHCVHVGLRDDHDRLLLLEGPKRQIVDFVNDRNGLASHGPTRWQAPAWEMTEIARLMDAWRAPVRVKVYRSDGATARCFAFASAGQTWADVRAVVELLGGTVTWNGHNAVATLGKVTAIVPLARLQGDTVRASLRSIVEELGRRILSYTDGTPAKCVIG